MSYFKKIFAAILFASLLISYAGCSDKNENVTESAESSGITETEAAESEQTKEELIHSVPENLKFPDDTISFICCMDEDADAINISEQSADLIADAMYRRALCVQEELGINLNAIYKSSGFEKK